MHYELRLYPSDALGGASRRASSTGAELESALENPARVIEFDTLGSMAAAMFDDHDGLVGLTYAVEDDGTARPVSAAELAQAAGEGP
jgi:hypothetical protein